MQTADRVIGGLARDRASAATETSVELSIIFAPTAHTGTSRLTGEDISLPKKIKKTREPRKSPTRTRTKDAVSMSDIYIPLFSYGAPVVSPDLLRIEQKQKDKAWDEGKYFRSLNILIESNGGNHKTFYYEYIPGEWDMGSSSR